MSTLCDWTAGCFGGYGHTMTCQDGSVTMGAAKSHDQCVSGWQSKTLPSACTSMTVEGFEGCAYNVKCPLLWMDTQCSALQDCFLALLASGAAFRQGPVPMDSPAGLTAEIPASVSVGPLQSLRTEAHTP